MRRWILAGAGAATLALSQGGAAEAQTTVAVCSPTLTTNCVQPNADGSVNPATTYNTTPPAPASGATTPAQGDSQGDLKVYHAALSAGEDLPNNVQGVLPKAVIGATYSRSLDTSFGTLVTHNTKAVAGQLTAFCVTSVNAAVRYFQVYNSTGSTTGAPILSIPIPAGASTAPASVCLDDRLFGVNGLNFSIGITWGISTANGAYSAATASDHNVTLTYQ
jgi:hypothetical protein